jgi:hypothetical protein
MSLRAERSMKDEVIAAIVAIIAIVVWYGALALFAH